jgi:hypothetical protein
MAGKKYTGPERRTGDITRREPVPKRYPLTAFPVTISETTANRRLDEPAHGIVEIKEHKAPMESRMHGAGRRSGDLARALKTGEESVYQFGKGVWANAGKLAEKVIKKKLKLGP